MATTRTISILKACTTDEFQQLPWTQINYKLKLKSSSLLGHLIAKERRRREEGKGQ
jgi:hypothetical protein